MDFVLLSLKRSSSLPPCVLHCALSPDHTPSDPSLSLSTHFLAPPQLPPSALPFLHTAVSHLFLSKTLALFLSLSLQVVEIALKVSPILAPHMFHPLLPAVFRGILDGEVSSAFLLKRWTRTLFKNVLREVHYHHLY